jgi:hypothetical protein
LFVIYINDLPYGVYYTFNPIIYVDDTSVLNTAKSINNELQIKAKAALDYMSKWFLVNGLILNIYKTNIVNHLRTLS